MLEALCEAEGIDVSLVSSEAQDQSPHVASDIPSQLWRSDHIKDG
jgi:hypothetical protein